ncbi:DUF4917 family protein [Campylobacter jejuni]|nr:DUF4917 family protein [Campylobacter jejuni]
MIKTISKYITEEYYERIFFKMNDKNQLLTYEDIKRKMTMLSQKNNVLLLGNGFSIAYEANFSFENLINNMNKNDNIINNLFSKLELTNSHDIEEIMKHLEISQRVLECFDFNDKSSIVEEYKIKLKEEFIKIIREKHPKFLDEKSSTAIEFIEPYGNIFTLNYDLLLYWLIMEYNKQAKDDKRKKYCDGFLKKDSSLIFQEDYCDKNFFFLHGALHLFEIDNKLIKIRNKDKAILEQIIEQIDNKNYPVCVLGGDSNKKLEQILKNKYLQFCLEQLKTIECDNLVIFGTKLKENDEHIREAINSNHNIKNIFLGISDCEKRSEIKPFSTDKNIFFYDYRSVKLWK